MESVRYDPETRITRVQVLEPLRKWYGADAEQMRVAHDGIKSFARAQASISLTRALRTNPGTTYIVRQDEETHAPNDAERADIDGIFVVRLTMQALIDAIGLGE